MGEFSISNPSDILLLAAGQLGTRIQPSQAWPSALGLALGGPTGDHTGS